MSFENPPMKEKDKQEKEEVTPSVAVPKFLGIPSTKITPERFGGGPRTKEHQELMEKLREPIMSIEEGVQKRKRVEERLEEIEKSHKGFVDDKEKDSLENELTKLEDSYKKRNKKEAVAEAVETGTENVAESMETDEKLSMDTTKEVFLSKYKDYIKTRKLRESLGIGQKEKDWPDDLKDAMSKYRDSKVSYMQGEYRNKKQELFSGMSDMSGDGDVDIEAAQKANEMMDKEYFTANIFNEVELSQQEEVQKARVEALGVKEKNTFNKGLEWYSKRSMVSKALFTAAVGTGVLIGSGAFAGATVGAGAAAGIYAGQKVVRSLVGTLAGAFFGKVAGKVGENIVEKFDKKSEKEFIEKFDVRALGKMEGLSRERLDKVKSLKVKALVAKMVVSVSAAVIAGRATGDLLQSVDKLSGVGTLIPQTIPSESDTGETANGSYGSTIDGKPGVQGVGTAQDKIAEKIHNLVSGEPGTQEAFEYTAHVKPGDSVWKIIENKLQSQGDFKGMNEGQRTYLIDTFKDKITAMSPEKLKAIGILSGDPNALKAGENIDLSSVLGNTETLQNAKHASETLSSAASKAIEANNVKISDWAAAHPHEAITSSSIKDILSGNANVHPSDAQGAVQPNAFIDPNNAPEVKRPNIFDAQPDTVGKHITIDKIGVHSSSADDITRNKVELSGVMNGYTGTEVLSKNYLSKLDTSSMGESLARSSVKDIGRSLSLDIAAYNHLESIGEYKKAGVLLNNLHKSVTLYDSELGKGIIDHSKIPGMK